MYHNKEKRDTTQVKKGEYMMSELNTRSKSRDDKTSPLTRDDKLSVKMEQSHST